MKYMGSKDRLAKDILGIANRLNRKRWVEPFVGGGNMIYQVVGDRLGNDSNRFIVALLKALSEGWVPPDYVEKSTYQKAKFEPDAFEPHFIGWLGICCSYSGKWFGGFAGKVQTQGGERNYQIEAKRNVLNQSKGLCGVKWQSGSYSQIEVLDGDFIYCDPPYAQTTGYKDSFDHAAFYNWLREISHLGIPVLISEYSMPEDFVEIWSKPVKSSLSANGKIGASKTSTEKLFVHESCSLALF